MIVEPCSLERLGVEPCLKVLHHPSADIDMRGIRIFYHIFRNRLHCPVGRPLVKFVPVGRPVEAVQPEETGLRSERAPRIVLYETSEVRLRRIIVPEPVVAQTPVILYSIIPFRPAGQDRQRFEKSCGFGIFPIIEICERRLILRICIVTVQQSLIL